MGQNVPKIMEEVAEGGNDRGCGAGDRIDATEWCGDCRYRDKNRRDG